MRRRTPLKWSHFEFGNAAEEVVFPANAVCVWWKSFLTHFSSLGSFLFLDEIPAWPFFDKPFFGTRQYCKSRKASLVFFLGGGGGGGEGRITIVRSSLASVSLSFPPLSFFPSFHSVFLSVSCCLSFSVCPFLCFARFHSLTHHD